MTELSKEGIKRIENFADEAIKWMKKYEENNRKLCLSLKILSEKLEKLEDAREK